MELQKKIDSFQGDSKFTNLESMKTHSTNYRLHTDFLDFVEQNAR